MAAARAHVEMEHRGSYSSDACQELIFDIRFRQFDGRAQPQLSGFEHDAAGEQKGGKLKRPRKLGHTRSLG
jgi:hypothetical protein